MSEIISTQESKDSYILGDHITIITVTKTVERILLADYEAQKAGLQRSIDALQDQMKVIDDTLASRHENGDPKVAIPIQEANDAIVREGEKKTR